MKISSNNLLHHHRYKRMIFNFYFYINIRHYKKNDNFILENVSLQ